MRKGYLFILIVLVLAIGTFGGFFFGKSNVFADTAFWSGIANGNVVSEETSIQPTPATILITPNSVGEAIYPSGMTFDLKDLQVGQETSLTLYVRNYTKKITNIYTIVEATPNIIVYTPLNNSHIYPNGWAQFVFQVKALAIGPCSINIRFAKSEY
jgi:hypothetical protein